jgi:hypothetical protein
MSTWENTRKYNLLHFLCAGIVINFEAINTISKQRPVSCVKSGNMHLEIRPAYVGARLPITLCQLLE